MDLLSDYELWTLIKDDNNKAFKTLFDRYWERFYTICYWHLLDQDSAKDVVQDLFVDLWAKRKQININDTVEGYLKIAVRNRVFNYIRSQESKNRHIRVISKNMNEIGPSTDELHDVNELKKNYYAAIEKLPPKMRSIFIEIKEYGLTIEEVAKKSSLSEQTVKNQLGTAVKKLRVKLERYRPFG